MPAFFLSGEISLENTFYFSQFFSLLLQSWKLSWLFFLHLGFFFLNPKKTLKGARVKH